jgi:apolipoprotein D and lipocalin family protein
MALGPVLLLTAASLGIEEVRGLAVVENVDLTRYAGVWYEVARKPNWFQKKCARDIKATYALRADGRLDVVNECRTPDGGLSLAKGVARLADPKGPTSKLKVRFAPSWLSFVDAVWGDYWIVELAADYSYAVVGEPRRRYLWVLSRSPTMDATLLDGIVRRAAAHYDVSDLVRAR